MILQKRVSRQRFKELTYPHMKLVYNVALKYTGNVFDAEDIVQETYMMAFNKFHQLKDPSRCKPWLLRILRNNFLKNCQKAKSQQRLLETDYIEFLKQQVRTKDADKLLARAAGDRAVREAIDKLPFKYREVLLLYYMDDMLYKEIAQALDIPIGTVMSRLTRAREGLKASLLKNLKQSGDNVLDIDFKQPPKNMNCKEFYHWLETRDIHEAVLPGEVAGHMAKCSDCERLFHCDTRLEDAIRKGMRMEEMPRGLADQISASLDHQRPSKPSEKTKIAVSALALMTILLAALYFPFAEKSPPQFKDLNQIGIHAVQGHLAGNRHMSFTASEADRALAMLTTELGFQVLLPDLGLSGCTLLGGRLCLLGDCRAAYFVLDRNGRAGSLYIMDTRFLSFDMAEGSRFNTRIKGCEADVWKENGQIYAMVF